MRRIAIAVLVVLAALPAAAQAAFPGQNGRIAYDDDPTLSNADIYSVNSDGSGGVTQLTSDPANDFGPQWSPDGGRIAFVSNREGLGSQVYVMNSDGSGQTRITDPPTQSVSPAWAPDGQRLVFGRSGDLWTMDADGANQASLTSLTGSERTPAWSPDGQRIAFTHDRSPGDTVIRTIRPDGADLADVTTIFEPPCGAGFQATSSNPDWAPDGSRIVYLAHSNDDGETCSDIRTIRPDGTGRTTVIAGCGSSCVNTAGNAFSGPEWSPNGSRFASWGYNDDFLDLFTFGPFGGPTTIGSAAYLPGLDWQPLPVNTPSTYIRPQGATPIYASLVTAFKPCTASNRTHGPPLAHPSCNPPVPASPHLRISVGESQLRSIGSLRARLIPGAPGGPDDTDVQLTFSLTNVMRASDFSEYSGEVGVRIPARVTDREGSVSSTTQTFPLSWSVPCAPTADPQIASACASTTTLDAVLPGAAAEGTRAIWAFDAVEVHDGGSDGNADTLGDNSLFMKQGVFVP